MGRPKPLLRPRPLLHYLDDNLAGNPTLEDAAREARLSPYHFARMFKESTGLSPHRYLIERRVERAKEILANTDLSVAEIALEAGFSHHGHLGRHFGRLVGATPSTFREERRR